MSGPPAESASAAPRAGDGAAPRVLSERRGKLLLNLFPPFLFNRIRVLEIRDGFRRCRVRVRPSRLTRNLQGTTFGGTIFSAADPFHALLYWQVLAHRGLRVQAWLKSARIEYRRPAASALTFDFALTEADILEAEERLGRDGRFSKVHRTEAIDEEGRVCAVVDTEVYLRLPRAEQPAASAF
jgi:acyl-coenzyme A thioesterase PaaI-like protein